MFRAWQLPATDVREARTLLETRQGNVLVPVLAADEIRRIAERLVVAGEALRGRSTNDVVGAIDRVARRFLDPADALRTEALHWLPAVSGYSPAMCQRVLDRMAADWLETPLRRLLRAELRDPSVLTEFVQHAAGQRVRAVPPRLSLHILSGNVPGVGVTSIIRALLVRAPALCKTARDEPVLAPLFARALAEHDQELARALAVTYWPGGHDDIEQAALAHADVVIHYGNEAALADLRARAPAHARLVEHGARISFAAIASEHAGRRATARDAALAVAMFDQQGCVSPHIIYVEEGGSLAPREFGARLAAELDRLRHDLPRGRITPHEAARIQHLRGEIEFRAIAGENVASWAGEDLSYTVAFDADPAFTGACLHRTVWLKPIYSLDALPGLLRGFAPLLQTAGLAAPPERRRKLALDLSLAGVSRTTTLARMPWPGPSWHHDGRGPLRELLRFSDLETRI